ncbi:hypothetical protein MESS2_1270021 [Mesorhizobium metallidurans STM 2683]|uniref:Uncharacterized protein n=1 Tax=Mesorhizobium metallidurans STM 2683 TaxID=1297569 RepID=M5EXL1_9HYPH|nr:hypothetical protein MESS2_1270021 [Mesorhizobium metallidurans STM 2683]
MSDFPWPGTSAERMKEPSAGLEFRSGNALPGRNEKGRKGIRPVRNCLIPWEETGAGEAIRTLDPNLGKVVLYP